MNVFGSLANMAFGDGCQIYSNHWEARGDRSDWCVGDQISLLLLQIKCRSSIFSCRKFSRYTSIESNALFSVSNNLKGDLAKLVAVLLFYGQFLSQIISTDICFANEIAKSDAKQIVTRPSRIKLSLSKPVHSNSLLFQAFTIWNSPPPFPQTSVLKNLKTTFYAFGVPPKTEFSFLNAWKHRRGGTRTGWRGAHWAAFWATWIVVLKERHFYRPQDLFKSPKTTENPQTQYKCSKRAV